MAANFQNIQPSKSIMESVHKASSNRDSFQQQSSGTNVKLLVITVLLVLILLVEIAVVPFTIFLHTGDKVVDGFRGTDGGNGPLIKAGNSVFMEPKSEIAYNQNVEPTSSSSALH